MRYKDEKKLASIFDATLNLVNELGLQGTSISKIAKMANVSPATIYIYFDNKEDLINKLYLSAKEDMSHAIFTKIDGKKSLSENYQMILEDFCQYVKENEQHFLFVEQLQNSPVISEEIFMESDRTFEPMYEIYKKGIEEGIIKDVKFSILKMISFQPLVEYMKQCILQKETTSTETISQIIQMCWKAITN